MDTALIRLRSALEHDPHVNLHRDEIRIELADGLATVSGEVSDIAAKRLTLEQTAALPEVTGIVDRLHVRPATPMGDGEIADHLQHALMRDSAFDQCEIRTRVRDRTTVIRSLPEGQRTGWLELRVDEGIITLDGDAPSLSHKRLAGALAWWVPGSRDVINGLGVEPHEVDSDAEILDALRIVLDKDPLLDSAQLRASCVGACVTLDGWVASDAERRCAEFDAWSLFGVDKVENPIQVG